METLLDRALRKAKLEPTCRCEKCGTAWQQLGDRIEGELSRPFMRSAFVTLCGLLLVVVIGYFNGGFYVG